MGGEQLITGGNRGLGLEITREMANQGAKVVVIGRGSSPELDAIDCAKVITGVDVTDSESVASAVANEVVGAVGGTVDIVINNAGYFYGPHESVLDKTLNFDEELKQIDICAVGPLRVSAALQDAGMLKEGSQVAIISSQAGSVEWRLTQNPQGGDYGHHMSRAACNIMGVLLSQELKAKGIPVVLLHPGFNRTGMTKKFEHIWEIEGAVDPSEGAKRVLHEIKSADMSKTGQFINCEDGLRIPW